MLLVSRVRRERGQGGEGRPRRDQVLNASLSRSEQKSPPATVVGYPARLKSRPGTRSGRTARAKDATTVIVQHVSSGSRTPAWSGLLWGLALLGLLLLPTNYRAGAEIAHGHALIQVWFDAAHGAIHHHHVPGVDAAPRAVVQDWLEPAVVDSTERDVRATGDARPDVGSHQDSAPVGGSVHLLVMTVVFLVLAVARSAPSVEPGRAPQGRVTRILLPPPRWTPLAG